MINKNKELNNRYGHLLDKYVDKDSMELEIRMRREEEAKTKYGNLLDNAKPDYTMWNNIKRVYEMRDQTNQKRREEEEKANLRFQERIKDEKRKEEEHNASVKAYGESILERRWAEKEAEAKTAEEKRMETERKKSTLNSIQNVMDMSENLKKMSLDIKNRLEYERKKDEERQKQREWYEKQEGYMKNRK